MTHGLPPVRPPLPRLTSFGERQCKLQKCYSIVFTHPFILFALVLPDELEDQKVTSVLLGVTTIKLAALGQLAEISGGVEALYSGVLVYLLLTTNILL